MSEKKIRECHICGDSHYYESNNDYNFAKCFIQNDKGKFCEYKFDDCPNRYTGICGACCEAIRSSIELYKPEILLAIDNLTIQLDEMKDELRNYKNKI